MPYRIEVPADLLASARRPGSGFQNALRPDVRRWCEANMDAPWRLCVRAWPDDAVLVLESRDEAALFRLSWV